VNGRTILFGGHGRSIGHFKWRDQSYLGSISACGRWSQSVPITVVFPSQANGVGAISAESEEVRLMGRAGGGLTGLVVVAWGELGEH
jgi:hypothetical protein